MKKIDFNKLKKNKKFIFENKYKYLFIFKYINLSQKEINTFKKKIISTSSKIIILNKQTFIKTNSKHDSFFVVGTNILNLLFTFFSFKKLIPFFFKLDNQWISYFKYKKINVQNKQNLLLPFQKSTFFFFEILFLDIHQKIPFFFIEKKIINFFI